jgi:hypothetical protein
VSADVVVGRGTNTGPGDPVEHTNKVYATYSIPTEYTVGTNYESSINRFFGDVAAANGSKIKVYSSLGWRKGEWSGLCSG